MIQPLATSTAGNQQRPLSAPGLFPAREISIPALMGGIPPGHGSGWHQLRVCGRAGAAHPSVRPGGATRSCVRWPWSQGGAATGAGQRSRTAPWCSGTAGSECPQPQHGHEVGCNPKNPQNPQVAANSRCGGMSRSTRGQTKSFRSDPHLPWAEIHSFEVS